MFQCVEYINPKIKFSFQNFLSSVRRTLIRTLISISKKKIIQKEQKIWEDKQNSLPLVKIYSNQVKSCNSLPLYKVYREGRKAQLFNVIIGV